MWKPESQGENTQVPVGSQAVHGVPGGESVEENQRVFSIFLKEHREVLKIWKYFPSFWKSILRYWKFESTFHLYERASWSCQPVVQEEKVQMENDGGEDAAAESPEAGVDIPVEEAANQSGEKERSTV